MARENNNEVFDDDFDLSDSSEYPSLVSKQSDIEGNTETFNQKALTRSGQPLICPHSTFESEEEFFDDIHFPESMDSLALASPRSSQTLMAEESTQDDFWSGLIVQDESVFSLDRVKHKNIVPRPRHVKPRRQSFSVNLTSPYSSTLPIGLGDTTDSESAVELLEPHQSENVKCPSGASLSNLSSNGMETKISHAQPSTPSQISSSLVGRIQTVPEKSSARKKVKSTSLNTQKNNSFGNPSGSPRNTSNATTKGKFEPAKKAILKTIAKETLVSHTSKPPPLKSSKINEGLPKTKPHTSRPSEKKVFSNINDNRSLLKTNVRAIPKSKSVDSSSRTESGLLFRRPTKLKILGDGSELDKFDDLPFSVDDERAFEVQPTSIKNSSHINSLSASNDDRDNECIPPANLVQNNPDCDPGGRRKWRRKPTLIRNLNPTKKPKVIGEMVYDPNLQRWNGNESVLKEFEAYLTPPSRPTLIRNVGSTNTTLIEGNMRFDPVNMCWRNVQPCEEDDILNNLENNDEDNDMVPEATNKSNDFKVGGEFDITPGFLAALIAAERQHGNEMSKWYPAAGSLKNEQRFGLRDPNIQRGYLYEIKAISANRSKSGCSSSTRSRLMK